MVGYGNISAFVRYHANRYGEYLANLILTKTCFASTLTISVRHNADGFGIVMKRGYYRKQKSVYYNKIPAQKGMGRRKRRVNPIKSAKEKPEATMWWEKVQNYLKAG